MKRVGKHDAFFGVTGGLRGVDEAPRVYKWDADTGTFWATEDCDMPGVGERFGDDFSAGLGWAQFGSRDKHEVEMWIKGFVAALRVLDICMGGEA